MMSFVCLNISILSHQGLVYQIKENIKQFYAQILTILILTYFIFCCVHWWCSILFLACTLYLEWYQHVSSRCSIDASSTSSWFNMYSGQYGWFEKIVKSAKYNLVLNSRLMEVMLFWISSFWFQRWQWGTWFFDHANKLW